MNNHMIIKKMAGKADSGIFAQFQKRFISKISAEGTNESIKSERKTCVHIEVPCFFHKNPGKYGFDQGTSRFGLRMAFVWILIKKTWNVRKNHGC